MKNTIKLIGFIAVVAIVGLSFVTCGEPEDTVLVFSNESENYAINVWCDGCTPSQFTLEKLVLEGGIAFDGADEVTVTKAGGGLIPVRWDVVGINTSKEYFITMDTSGSKVVFRDADERLNVKK
jgi:hypothetical protein